MVKCMYIKNRNDAFTLAEVLITLGIIGIVAAITIPIISENVQKIILKRQFKKAYSTFSNAVFSTQTRMEIPVGCHYWLKGNLCPAVCVEYNEFNTCKRYQCADGSPLSPNHNGPTGDCKVFNDELFNNTLKVVKYCKNNALSSGCLTDEYRGIDKVKAEQNPDKQYDSNMDFSDSNIKNRYPAWILSDGTLIIKYFGAVPLYLIDINGHKGPNKWGYDIHTFMLKGDNNGIKKIQGFFVILDKGGKSTEQMIEESF